MKIDFGFNKVAIYTGMVKDTDIGVCELQKLLIPNDETSIGDVPCIIRFHNVKSIDALISSLEHLRSEMINEQ